VTTAATVATAVTTLPFAEVTITTFNAGNHLLLQITVVTILLDHHVILLHPLFFFFLLHHHHVKSSTKRTPMLAAGLTMTMAVMKNTVWSPETTITVDTRKLLLSRVSK